MANTEQAGTGRERWWEDEAQDFAAAEDARATWQCDVDECEECQAHDDESVCPDHDLDDPHVAARYDLAG